MLKLVDQPADAGVMLFDRRSSPRNTLRGQAMAKFIDLDGRVRVGWVRFLDSSLGGLGLSSPLPIEVGTRVELYFNSTGPTWGLPGRMGDVVRSEAWTGTDGQAEYRLGVRTPARAAAA